MTRGDASHRRLTWGLIGALGLVVLLVNLVACSGRRRRRVDPAAGQLAELIPALQRYDFGPRTVRALRRAVEIAEKARGADAAEAWSQVARTRLDWFLVATLGRDAPLLRRLLSYLGMDERKCARGAEVRYVCLAHLASRITLGFENAAVWLKAEKLPRLARQAEREAALVRLAVVHRRVGGVAFATALGRALRDEPVIVRRARLLAIERWLAAGTRITGLGPDRAAETLARRVPYPCPRAFLGAPAFSGRALERALAACDCSYICKRARELAQRLGRRRDPTRLAQVVRRCGGFADRLLTSRAAPYLTPQAFIAVQALGVFAHARSRGLGTRKHRLDRRLSGLFQRFAERLRTLQVALPYPASLHLRGRDVAAPVLPASARRWPFAAGMHVVVIAEGIAIGLPPTLGFGAGRVALLDAQAGFRLPGHYVGAGAASYALRRLLVRARRHASRRPDAADAAIFADRSLPLARVIAVMARLAKLGVRRFEILYGDATRVAWGVRATLRSRSRGSVPASGAIRVSGRKQGQQPLGAWLRALLAKHRSAAQPHIVFD